MTKILFTRDFEGHHAGDVVILKAGQLSHFDKKNCIEVMEDIIPEPKPKADAAVTPKLKKGSKAK